MATSAAAAAGSPWQIRDGCLKVGDEVVLSRVAPNITLTTLKDGAAFVGATSRSSSSRHVFNIGVLRGHRFLSLFRFKLWWMIPTFGDAASKVPVDTQMLLLEAREASAPASGTNVTGDEDANEIFYVIILPVLDGPFRTSLQGTDVDTLQFCAESGDPNVQTSKFSEAVLINTDTNPFDLIKKSIRILEKHKGTFSCIEHKKLPAQIDLFGWSTWDAFYDAVDRIGIEEGLKSLLKGGFPPKWLIIDDGWQNILHDTMDNHKLADVEGLKYVSRQVNFDANPKFKGSGQGKPIELQEFCKSIKEKYGVKYVYAWHTVLGYWGGVSPTSEGMKKYTAKIIYPVQSPGNLSHVVCGTILCVEDEGVAFIEPSRIRDFYEDFHRYLASCGVNGVKVDDQNLLELLGSGYGGRVALTREFLGALEESVINNFKDISLISSMCMSTDYLYSAKKVAVARVSEDFMPTEPTFQTMHIAGVAYTCLLAGEIIVPDWDMFHSNHYTAKFHAAARAIGGCAVYVSDKPGEHGFDVIKRLVLPDGSILRARYAGRPTRDCLFSDPITDGKSLMKIWNLNKITGVLGVFNCQRGGIWPPIRGAPYNPPSESEPFIISGIVSPRDVEFLGEVAGEDWLGDCAVYSYTSGELSRMPKKGRLEVTLGFLGFEVFTVSPIRVFDEKYQFAPLGLLDMYNSGGAVEVMNSSLDSSGRKIEIQVRGCGRFGAYSNSKPRSCSISGKEEDLGYDAENGMLTITLPQECTLRTVAFVY
ncbi:hypothetical protein ACJRO7_009370 [Eucalyptus globulus]|uniref:galactinol--sucrose galactosyltransferase n=1 Tax=Eucalyptus globulus TaxID=34317 RepID=A0ABD3L8H8_EUCGL